MLTLDCNSEIQLDFKEENLFYTRDEITYAKIPIGTQEINQLNKYDVIIIGAGLSACYIACQIRALLPRLKILLIDENEYFLQNFIEKTNAINQKTLRSSYSHQLAPDGFLSLLDYARLHYAYLTPLEHQQITLALMGQRAIVPLDVFLKHSTHVIRSFSLDCNSFRGSVISVKRNDNEFNIRLSDNTLLTSFTVISATGSKISTHNYNNNSSKVYNCYDHSSYIKNFQKDDKIKVSGAGLSAAYIIYDLIKRGLKVEWRIRDEIKFKCADVATKYFREEGVENFKSKSLSEKYLIINNESKGSLMPEFYDFIERNILQKNISIVNQNKFDTVNNCDKFIECHGLSPRLELIQTKSLYNCLPVINSDLEIEAGHFIIGKNASLEIGPAAKNIDGFRIASEKILPKIANLFNEKLEYHSYKRLITSKRTIK